MEPGLTFSQLDLDADTRFVGLRRALGVSTFGMNLVLLAPGQRGRVHRHERQEEVYLVLEGTLSLTLEDAEHDLGRGELVRVAPDVRRQLVNRGPGRCALLALGGSAEHDGRDGVAFTGWDDTTGARPQEIALPDDLPPSQRRREADPI